MRDQADDLPIGLAAGQGLDGFAHALHAPLGVGEGAVLFGVGSGRQDDVRQLRRLAQEDILHDQKLGVLERGVHVLDVGVGERGIFAHHPHRFDLARFQSVDHFDEGQADFFGQFFHAPGLAELFLDLGLVDRLIGREHVWKRAHVARALHVVLSAQGVDAAAGFADVTGQHRQISRLPDVLDAGGVLGDAHGEEDGGFVRFGVEMRRLDQFIGRDAADLLDALRGVVRHFFFERLEALGALFDEGLVRQPVADDDVHHAVNPGQVGAGFLAQVQVGDLRDLRKARIRHDEFRPLLLHLHQVCADDGMLFGGVRADDQRHVRLFQVGERIGHRSRTERSGQTGHGGRVSETGAVIHVVRADHRAGELLVQVVFFVGGFGRREEGDAVGSVLGLDLAQTAGDERKGFVPGGLDQFSIFADERRCQAVFVIDKVMCVPAFDA